jgi:carbon-monoxide dehydrogenase large subunit
VDDGKIPGAISLVARHGKVAHFETYGRSEVQSGRQMTADPIFRIYSMPKPLPRVPGRLFPLPEHEPFYQPVIALSKVRYVGEPLALVIAESPALGEDALELIEVDIEPRRRCRIGPRRSRALSLVEAHGSNCAIHYRTSEGRCRKAFAMADRVVRQQFASIGTPGSRWSRAASSRNGTPAGAT